MILADSSVLVDVLLARRTAASDRLRDVVRDRTPWAVPLPCLQEVLQGARDKAEWRVLRKFFDAEEIAHAGDGRAVSVEAGRIYFECRRRGITIRSSVDCLIAALALERNDVLLHDDDDFDRIARVRPLKTLRG